MSSHGRHLTTFTFFLLLIACVVFAKDDINAIIPLSRHRRFAIPTLVGATFTSEFTLSFPIEDAVWPFEINYALTYDYDTQSFTGRRRRKRDILSTHEESRMATIKNLEGYAKTWLPRNVSAHSCALRAICECARAPLHSDGLLGHLLNSLLLLPTHLVQDKTPGADYESDYLAAQRSGQFEDQCLEYEKNCRYSLFEIQDGFSYGGDTDKPCQTMSVVSAQVKHVTISTYYYINM